MTERHAWLAERRAATKSVYDADAPTYDLDEYQGTLHRRFVDRLLDTCPPDGVVLDAPCGTGHYFAQATGSGRRVVGIDQSTGMLAVARARGLGEVLEPVALQELAFVAAFDAAMCIDAMENVGPEDWPLVLANLRRAVRPAGFVYLTVEEQVQALLDAAYASQVARGLPVVRGEVVDGEAFAGYHYYPDRAQVVAWLNAEGLEVVEEAYEVGPDGTWGYRHFLVRDTRPRRSESTISVASPNTASHGNSGGDDVSG